jgi:GT2 family glycosyltransferase
MEIIIIDNGSNDIESLDLLDKLREENKIIILTLNIPFNYSKLNNLAAKKAGGEFIIFMNNDVEIIEKNWLKEMISHCLRPNVGTVGARLLYEDQSMQHAGVVLGIGNFKGGPGIAGHFFAGEIIDNHGYFQHSILTRSVSANTAACMAIRRDLFHLVGGFDEVNLAVEYNDIDLCLRISEIGRYHIWTPFAELLHKERASRGPDLSPEDVARSNRENVYMRQRWGSILDQDPFYNSQFSRLRQNYELCIPARRNSPWRITFD